MAEPAERTPIEELHYRMQQFQTINPGWDIHTLNLAQLEVLLVKHDTSVPRHQSLPADVRDPDPTPREQWRRIWIDTHGHWHSKQAAPPGVVRGRPRHGPWASTPIDRRVQRADEHPLHAAWAQRGSRSRSPDQSQQNKP